MRALIVLTTRLWLSMLFLIVPFLGPTLYLSKKWSNVLKAFLVLFAVVSFTVSYFNGGVSAKDWFLFVAVGLILSDRVIYSCISLIAYILMLPATILATIASKDHLSYILLKEIKEYVTEYEYFEFYMEYSIYKMFNLDKSQFFAKVFDGLLGQKDKIHVANMIAKA